MKKIIFLAIIIYILSAMNAIAGHTFKSKPENEKLIKQDQVMLDDANGYFKQMDYNRALGMYKALIINYPNNAEIVFKTGICYLYKPDEKEKSIDLLLNAAQLDPGINDLQYFIGKAFHINGKFNEAIDYFEKYLNNHPNDSKKAMTEQAIANCKNGLTLTIGMNNCIVTNFGKKINSEYREANPSLSGNEQLMVFTYKGDKCTGGLLDEKFNPNPNGDFNEDIFYAIKNADGAWESPQAISKSINTEDKEFANALSFDGQKLLLYKSAGQDNGDIYMSLLNGNTWSEPKKLDYPINTTFWEGNASLSADERTIYFSSDRPGGMGEKDLYKSEKAKDGNWGPAINLGPNINSALDDDAPCIFPDGKTLFFSSKGHNSMGGYDIFYSQFHLNAWSKPINMGTPFNSPEDDFHYMLGTSGKTGYFSSYRKDGYGEQDLYSITPGFPGKVPSLVFVKGRVLLDNAAPIAAQIDLFNANSGKSMAHYTNNASNGNYVLALPPEEAFKIEFNADGLETHVEYINTLALDTNLGMEKDISLFTKEYRNAKRIDTLSTNILQTELNRILKHEVVKQEVVKHEAVKLEQAKRTEVVKTEVVKTEVVKPEVVKPEVVKPEVVKTEVVKPEVVKTEVAQTGVDFNALASLVGKSLNDPTNYNLLMKLVQHVVVEGLVFQVQVGAYRHPENFKTNFLASIHQQITTAQLPGDDITRFTFGSFHSIQETEKMRQLAIRLGAKDAWITALYKGKRMTLEELVPAKFYLQSVN